MSTFTFGLGATISGVGGKFVDGDLDLITINAGAGAKKLKTDLGATLSADFTTITIPSYGTLTATGDDVSKVYTFTASSSVAAGTYAFADANGTWDKLNFAATTNAIDVVGTAATTIIKGGAGNDTIKGGSAVTATVTGGAGADKFVQNAAIGIKVDDYNYADGDSLTQTAAFGGALAADGTYTDGAVVVKAAAADNAYKVKATAAGTKGEYWTAKAATSVNLDGTGKTDKLVIDVTKAINSQVTLGGAGDVVSVAGSQVTLTAGKTNGTATINNFTQDFTGDVLNLKDATVSDITWGTNLTIGAGTQLTGIGNATKGKLLVQENGGSVKKVAYTTAAAQKMDMTNSEVADLYQGYKSTTAGDKVTLDASAVTNYGTFINLLDTTKYKNITDVLGAVSGGTYVGTVDSHDITGATGTTIDLSAATLASSQVWGGSSAKDTITFAANGVKDTMWFGTTDGVDNVTGFAGGFGAANDVLNLYDVADLTTVSFTAGAGTPATDLIVKAAASNTVELLGTAVGNVAQLKLQDKAGNVKKVAVSSAAGAGIIIDAVDANSVAADVVIGHSAGNNTVRYDANQKTDVFVNLQDTTKYKNIANINLAASTGAHNTAVGSATAGSAIALGGSTTDVWGGSSLTNAITGGAGADTMWFGANDGADTFAGFGASDKIKFYDKSIAELAKAYTFGVVGGAGVFTSTAKATDTLTLTAVPNGVKTVLDKDNKAAKLVFGAGPLDYASDAKVYMGNGASQVTVATTDNVFLYLGNGKDATVGDVYFSGVTAIDASASTGNTVLCGAANKADVLTGGSTSSAMWGGGIANDTMVGAISAVDEFWFGSGDGADAVTVGVTKQDKVVLYNATSVSDVTMTVNAGNFVVTATDGSTLTVTDTANTALDGGLTFQFGADTSAKSYTYNKVSKTFVAK